jgi:glutamate-1-semialdehyde aminotransferase
LRFGPRDLTTLAKIVAGGLPGGALCGKRELMSMLAFRGDPDWERAQRVAHAGTFNANPLSARRPSRCSSSAPPRRHHDRRVTDSATFGRPAR